MIKNYFISTYRNLWRNKLSTLINITGLTVSIACCIVIYVFIKNEKTFDNFHTKADRIYRIVYEEKTDHGTDYNGSSNFALANALRNDFPNLESVTQIYMYNNGIIQVANSKGERKIFEEDQITYADDLFFKTFNFPLIAGSTNKLLSNPDEVVLSRKIALKYFGNHDKIPFADLIGKVILINKNPYHIAAIMEDMPGNTNFSSHMLLPFKNFERSNPKLVNNWQENFSRSHTFVTLPIGYSSTQFENGLSSFKNKYLDKETAARETYHVQPLSSVHTDSKYEGTYYSTPSILIIAFVIMGIVILLTACINFINLATAQSFNRAKEIGIRKTLGSKNNEIIFRFMGETMIIIIFASGIAVFLANWFLNSFNNYLSFIIEINLHTDFSVFYFLVPLAIIITFLAGFYPAKMMSRFQPVEALKGILNSKNVGFSSKFSYRKALIVSQFVVTQLLILGTIIVASQMNFFYNKDLGYRKENVLTVEIPNNNEQKLSLFRDRLLTQPQIEKVSFNSGPPTSSDRSTSDFRLPSSPKAENIRSERKFVDENYLSTFKIKLLAGRDLLASDKVLAKDSTKSYNVLLNNVASNQLGFKNPIEAIGKTIIINDKDNATIIGVTDNFYNNSLQKNISPVILFNSKDWVAMATISMSAATSINTYNFIKNSWEKIYPDNFFKSMALSDYFRNKAFYVMEDIMYEGFKVFSLLSIIIGCMGLYGLVVFLATKRQKEIGIRKVLGASAKTIIQMFVKEFAMLITIAFLIASPLGYFAMNTWLETFTNRITLNPVYFIFAFIISLIIAGFTVSFQCFKAAMSNPVKSLKSE